MCEDVRRGPIASGQFCKCVAQNWKPLAALGTAEWLALWLLARVSPKVMVENAFVLPSASLPVRLCGCTYMTVGARWRMLTSEY